MGINKVTAGLLLGISLLLVSCNSDGDAETVSKSKYDAVMTDYLKLKRESEDIVQKNIDQSASINNILQELSDITTMSNTVRANLETGDAQITQAEEIQNRINNLKDILAQQKSVNKENKELLRTIDGLNEIITQKEMEIATLKMEIENQRETIAGQEKTIGEQEKEIALKERLLLEYHQGMIYEMAEELYNVSHELPKVRGAKDKKNIKNTRYYILNKALECAQEAEKLKHPGAANLVRQINVAMGEE